MEPLAKRSQGVSPLECRASCPTRKIRDFSRGGPGEITKCRTEGIAIVTRSVNRVRCPLKPWGPFGGNGRGPRRKYFRWGNLGGTRRRGLNSTPMSEDGQPIPIYSCCATSLLGGVFRNERPETISVKQAEARGMTARLFASLFCHGGSCSMAAKPLFLSKVFSKKPKSIIQKGNFEKTSATIFNFFSRFEFSQNEVCANRKGDVRKYVDDRHGWSCVCGGSRVAIGIPGWHAVVLHGHHMPAELHIKHICGAAPCLRGAGWHWRPADHVPSFFNMNAFTSSLMSGEMRR